MEAASRRVLDDLQGPAHLSRNPVEERAGGGLIGPQVAHVWELGAHVGAHELRTVAVLRVGRMHDCFEEQTERVDQHMPLAAVDLLAAGGVVRGALFGRLDRLTVENGSAGCRRASGLAADALAQDPLDACPGAVQPPAPDRGKDGRPWPVVTRARAPATTTT